MREKFVGPSLKPRPATKGAGLASVELPAMRLTPLLASLLVGLASLSALALEGWEQPAHVPTRVHYNQGTEQQLRPTVEQVRAFFSGSGTAEQLTDGPILVVGPFLWKRFQDRPELASKGIPSTFRIPGPREVVLDGRAFHKDSALAGAVLMAMRQELKQDGSFHIRKLNDQELDLLWTMWGFDQLDDPLLLVESAHHRYVLIFVKGSLMQVDDFFQAAIPSAGAAPARGQAHPFVQQTADHFWSAPPSNVDPSKLISGEGIQLLSPDEVIHRSFTTDVFVDYTQQLLAARNGALASADKTPRNLGIQVELRPDGEFFTVVCQPALPSFLEQRLKQKLAAVPHPPVHSVVAVQFFCRLWGGAPR